MQLKANRILDELAFVEQGVYAQPLLRPLSTNIGISGRFADLTTTARSYPSPRATPCSG